MLSNTNTEQLYLWADECFAIQRKLALSTRVLTPVNFEEEKRKFFSSKTYNPIFYYGPEFQKDCAEDIRNLRTRLDKLKMPREVKKYLKEYITDLQLQNTTVKSIGTPEYWYYAKQLFHYHDESADVILNALPKITPVKGEKKKLLDAYEIAEAFEMTLQVHYGIYDYSVEVDTLSPRIIRAGYGKAVIGSKVKRFQENVDRLIVHEIESHVLQNYNIRVTKNPLIKLSLHRDLHLYTEGLAVYNEIATGTITEKALRDYTYRLKAVAMLHKSFRHIFNYLSHYMNEDHAYLMTYRVKRGMQDTERHGGFPKDAAYLMGVVKINEFVEHGSRLEFLYLGKIPTLTSLLSSNGLLTVCPIYLPEFLKHPSTLAYPQAPAR